MVMEVKEGGWGSRVEEWKVEELYCDSREASSGKMVVVVDKILHTHFGPKLLSHLLIIK